MPRDKFARTQIKQIAQWLGGDTPVEEHSPTRLEQIEARLEALENAEPAPTPEPEPEPTQDDWGIHLVDETWPFTDTPESWDWGNPPDTGDYTTNYAPCHQPWHHMVAASGVDIAGVTVTFHDYGGYVYDGTKWIKQRGLERVLEGAWINPDYSGWRGHADVPAGGGNSLTFPSDRRAEHGWIQNWPRADSGNVIMATYVVSADGPGVVFAVGDDKYNYPEEIINGIVPRHGMTAGRELTSAPTRFTLVLADRGTRESLHPYPWE